MASTVAISIDTPHILDLSIQARGDRPPLHRISFTLDGPDAIATAFVALVRGCQRAHIDPWPLIASAVTESFPEGPTALTFALRHAITWQAAP